MTNRIPKLTTQLPTGYLFLILGALFLVLGTVAWTAFGFFPLALGGPVVLILLGYLLIVGAAISLRRTWIALVWLSLTVAGIVLFFTV